MTPTQPPTGSKQRSPNYPSISLKEAIDKVRKVYESEHTHPASREVVARDLGYNSLNGASLPLIGSLKRYNLLEDAGEGLKVSDDAVTILELPEDEPERNAALLRSAFAPTFFQELKLEFGEKLPSDANLRHYLIKRRFLPKAADELIRVYRDNLKLVGSGDVAYDEGMNSAAVEDKPAAVDQPTTTMMMMKPVSVAGAPMRQDVFSLAEGQVTIQWPSEISAESFEDVTDWLDILKRKIGRSLKKTEA